MNAEDSERIEAIRLTLEAEKMHRPHQPTEMSAAQAEAERRYPEHDQPGRDDFVAGAQWQAARYRGLVEAGKLVRDVWVEWAREQPDAKPSWLVPWSDLPERDREVDRRIEAAVRATEAARYRGLLQEVRGALFGIGAQSNPRLVGERAVMALKLVESALAEEEGADG